MQLFSCLLIYIFFFRMPNVHLSWVLTLLLAASLALGKEAAAPTREQQYLPQQQQQQQQYVQQQQQQQPFPYNYFQNRQATVG